MVKVFFVLHLVNLVLWAAWSCGLCWMIQYEDVNFCKFVSVGIAGLVPLILNCASKSGVYHEACLDCGRAKRRISGSWSACVSGSSICVVILCGGAFFLVTSLARVVFDTAQPLTHAIIVSVIPLLVIEALAGLTAQHFYEDYLSSKKRCEEDPSYYFG